MSVEFKFPDVGEGLTEGKLVSWKVKVGDAVEVDQVLADVETDKAVVQIPSPHKGTITKLHNEEGDTLIVGNVIVTFDGEGGNAPNQQQSGNQDSKDNEKKAEEKAAEKPIPESRPQTAVHSTEVPKVEEEHEAKPIPVFPEVKAETTLEPRQQTPVENSKGILAMPAVRKMARDHNIDLSQVHPTGNSGQITMDDLHNAAEATGTTIASEYIAPDPDKIPVPKPVNPIPLKQEIEELKHTTDTEFAIHNTENIGNLLNPSFATPKVRRYARHQGVDIHKVKGTGTHGLITESDIDAVSGIVPKTLSSKTTDGQKPGVSNEVITDQEKELKAQHIVTAPDIPMKDEDEIVPMSTIRKIISSRMRESQDNVAAVTHVEEVDMTNVYNLRAKEKETFAKLGVKLTYLPFIVKATLGALEQFPYFNATMKGDTIVLRKKYHIGIAVDTPRGLMVPVIRNVNTKSILEIAKEIVKLATQAKEKTIAPKDVTGGTFTITSVGNLGGISFTPIINYPEVAILGVAKIRDEPRIINNHIYARKVMNLCLTFDHRVVDGADAARFTSLIKTYLEDPQRLFMETL